MKKNRISKKDKRKKESEKQEILLSLPNFINQLILLSNSGMVITQCFYRIGETYKRMPESRQNSFTKSIVRLTEECKSNNLSIIMAFHDYARLSGLKELTRVGNILMENRSKGTDLWEKLEDQGDRLWEERKLMIMGDMKKAESKMSFPLALMLISLIIVTSAPAFMQIS